MSVKLGGKLPKESNNGLTAPQLISDLVADDGADRYHVVVAIVKRRKIERDDDSGELSPTLGIVRIEPVLDENEATAMRARMTRWYEKRLGRMPLPIPGLDDDEDDQDDAERSQTNVRDLRTASGVHLGGGDR